MMNRCGKFLAAALILMASAASVSLAGTWNLALPDTVILDRDVAVLGDVAGGPVPAGAQDLVIRAGLKPNAVVTVSRRDILRRLVTAGLAGGVRFTGVEICHLLFEGREVTPENLKQEVNVKVQKLVPTAYPGAPDSWFELELPRVKLASAGNWKISCDRNRQLIPGRNLVPITVVDQDRKESFTATIILHQFGEVGRARSEIARDLALEEDLFSWEWMDLADMKRGLSVGRASTYGASSTRKLSAGAFLREADLKVTPIVKAGDPVELQISRGLVAVTVRAIARQNGCLGQTIPVRSEVTGRLVNARVSGPGTVEWRR